MAHRSPRWFAPLLVLPLATLTQAQTTAPNVKVTIEFGRIEAGKTSSPSKYEMILPINNGKPSEINGGVRLPVPNGWSQASDHSSDASGVVAYSYRNVGLSAQLRVVQNSQGRLVLQGELDASVLKGWRAGHPDVPLIGNISQSVDVTVDAGKPVRVVSASDPDLGNLYVDITASPVD